MSLLEDSMNIVVLIGPAMIRVVKTISG